MEEHVDPISFGIISEGVTDQKVIKHILEGVFGHEGDMTRIVFVQPPNDETMRAGGEPPAGGWTLVAQLLKGDELSKASTLLDYLVIQIDTDVSEEPGFDVSHHGQSAPLSCDELCEKVESRLCDWIGDSCQNFILAVSVHSLECWLLPVLESKSAKQSKITGCMDAANKALRQKNAELLEKGGHKQPLAYAHVSKTYRKAKQLDRLHSKNPSLDRFVKRLEEIARQPDVVRRLELLEAQRDAW